MSGELRCGVERKALLVVDLLNDFMEPAGALFCGGDSRKIIPVVRRLVDAALAAHDLVVYLRDAHVRNDKEFELFPPHAIKGEWGAQIISELSPAPESVVIDKTRFSAFYGTSLAETLVQFQPREVWVAGVCTSICIMDTVGDLRNRDYAVVVPVNAVADFDEEFHAFALRRMQRVYGARLVSAPNG